MSQSEKGLTGVSSTPTDDELGRKTLEYQLRAVKVAECLTKHSTQKDYHNAMIIDDAEQSAESKDPLLLTGKKGTGDLGRWHSPPVQKEKTPELRHNHHRRFKGSYQKPHTAPWLLQRLQEDPQENSIALLHTWIHRTRHQEVSSDLIAEINELSTEDALTEVKNLREPKRYIQGTGGNKLTMRVILSTNDDQTLETDALLDSGSTGSCINKKYVDEHHIPTRKLPRPIPVYNADGTLNRNGAITEVVDLRLTIQDHSEMITLAVSDLGHTNLFIGHEWLKKHNPSIDWKESRIFFNHCHNCTFISNIHEIDHDDTKDVSQEKDEEIELEEGD